MDSENYVQRLNELENWLKTKGDCRPSSIAIHFKVHEKTARNLINKLRHRGLIIEYSKKTKSYVYAGRG